MITVKEQIFKLDTIDTSYMFRITEKGHLQHIYYGKRLPDTNLLSDAAALTLKNNIMFGSQVDYDKKTANYCLDSMMLEYSGIGKGDYRHSPMEMILPDGSFVTDFVYADHTVTDGAYFSDCGLPFAYDAGAASDPITGDPAGFLSPDPVQTLTIRMTDKKYGGLELLLNYTVFEDCNVIARNTELINHTEGEISIRRFMSYMLDLPEADYSMVTLDGGWAKEAHMHERKLSYGITVNDSTTGASSNRHNPAFLLKAKGADEEQGHVIGFNLVYSGNHYSAVEMADHDTLRIMGGINPHCFLWKLAPGESFVTPQAVMSFTASGTNGLMANMHDFVNRHIIREKFRYSPRPIVVNNWEATFFNFTKSKLIDLAHKAKDLGVEMFVLDDGWFGKRNSDTAGLGDWTVNLKKLPGGIAGLSETIHKLGMQFGLWFEPECVNEDSELFVRQPGWVIRVPGRDKSYGRNQLVLDLTRPEVQDYIVDSVSAILSSARIEYVKWDYNRHISDMYSSSLTNQGEFCHKYILGLYSVLRRIFCEKHPDVLLESCSSGGNRFDLGMLCFSPQIWTSDDTDARERIDIQRGITCFYPPSTVSNHVSMTPNQQTLRDVALSTRFHVASFGVLGYELNFGELSPEERRQIKDQIAFYKEHRMTFQYGRFARYVPRPGERESWQITDGQDTFAAIYNLSYHTSPPKDILRILSAREGELYTMTSVRQQLKISRFGSLIKHVSPVELNADGAIVRFVNRHYSMTDGLEAYTCSGEALKAGIPLAMQYSGTGYDSSLRILGDWGSTMYHISRLNQKS